MDRESQGEGKEKEFHVIEKRRKKKDLSLGMRFMNLRNIRGSRMARERHCFNPSLTICRD